MPASWGFPNPATPPGSSNYYSLRFSPPALRDDLGALLAWRHQVRAILTEVSDPGVARLKLAWWRDQVRGLEGDGQPRHPLTQVLSPLVARHRLPLAPFLAMADQVEREIRRQTPQDTPALLAACTADLGSLFELMGLCHGRPQPDTQATLGHLGALCGLVYRLRDSGWLARQGRAPIPLDRLRALGLTPDDLRQREGLNRLPLWLSDLARETRAMEGLLANLPGLPPFARIHARIQAKLLKELEAISFRVADQRLALTPTRKLWIAWRESRR